MTEHDAHPDEGTIHAWLDRQLDDTSAATLEAHLQRCDECAERVAEARGLIAGTSRILSSLDEDDSPASDKPAVESWRPAVLPTRRARGIPTFRFTPARSAIAAVLVVAVATAIVRENRQSSSRLASEAAASAVVASAPVTSAPVASAPVANAPVASAPVQPDTTAGARVAAARTFARTQRETTVSTDRARVAQVPSAPVASGVAGGVSSGVSRGAEPAPSMPTPPRALSGVEAPQCYRVESAAGTEATWGPVALPFVLALDRPATSNAARLVMTTGQESEAHAVFERRGDDSLLFTLRRIGYTGTLAVGVPGEVRAGVMRSSPATMHLESVVVTAAPTAGESRRALRKSSAARADSAPPAPDREAAPAVPVVVRRVECRQ